MKGEFTLSFHFYRSGDKRNHLELFLDLDGMGPLETWQCPRNAWDPNSKYCRFIQMPPHRRTYLTYNGPIRGNRGNLRILRRGKFIDRRLQKPNVSDGQAVVRPMVQTGKTLNRIKIRL
jgi:hypothetical protein